MEIEFSNLHHAYLLVGSLEEAEKQLHRAFASQNLVLLGSPDYFVVKEPVLGIDSARNIGAMAIRHSFSGKKIFLLAPETITIEAQNALLKVFEEPISETHFFLVVRNTEEIIPTLRSRMRVINILASQADQATSSTNLGAEKFLNSTLKERMSFVKKFIDAEKNLPLFLEELLLLLREKRGREAQAQVYEMCLLSRARGASSRLILEHLALVL